MKSYFLLPFLIFCSLSVTAQEHNTKLSVFLEGEIIDFNFIRRNVDFVDYLNDTKNCEVYILVTKISTAGDGHQYKMNFEGKNNPEIPGFNLTCNILPTDTKETSRRKFSETLKSGLTPFINNISAEHHISVELLTPSDISTPIIPNRDPWNNWIFSAGLKGGIEAEQRKKEYSIESSLSANRVTEEWRILNKYSFEREETLITKVDDQQSYILRRVNQQQNFRTKIVYSINEHWSLGMFAEANQDTYKNIRSKATLKPALEYNFFPWKDADRKLFTIAYRIGPELFTYYEHNILDRLNEKRVVQTLKSDVGFVQNWGQVNFWLEGSQYLQDPEYHIIESGCDLAVRVTRGLFLEISLEAKKINNQFYLAAGEISEEDLLLNVRKLPTSFEFSSEIGIRFTFGSIYNSIVNERL